MEQQKNFVSSNNFNHLIPIAQSVKVDRLRQTYKQKDIDLQKWINMKNEKGELVNLYVGRRGRIFITSQTVGPEGVKEKNIFHYPDSKWGNPYKLDVNKLNDSLVLYEKFIREKHYDELPELACLHIGCFCDMKPYQNVKDFKCTCHTHILIKLFIEYYEQNY